MTLTHPAALLAAVAVLIAAGAALFRPGSRVVIVPTLRFWRQAAEHAGPGRLRPRPRPSWWLLLTGALLAVLAASGPALRQARPRHTLALAIYPSAELRNPPGPDRLRAAAGAVLDELDTRDRVQLLLPARLGGASEWLTPEQARWRLGRVEMLAIPADRLSMPTPAEAIDEVVAIAPASLAADVVPAGAVIRLSTTTSAVRLDAVAAEAGTDGPVVFVAVRNDGSEAASVDLAIRDEDGTRTRAMSIPPGGREARLLAFAGDWLEVSLGDAFDQQARLVRTDAARLRVNVLGRDDPHVRRLLSSMPGVEIVPADAPAEAVFAVGAELPDGAAGVALNPPTPPAGWSVGEQIGPVNLGALDVRNGDPLLAHVDFAGVSLRRAQPWRAGEGAQGRVLLGDADAALAIAADPPRRLLVAFDPSPANTNWGLHESFVILLANAIAPLAEGPARPTWRLDPEVPAGVGLAFVPAEAENGRPILSAGPRLVRADVLLWPYLAGAAGVLWLLGWWVRARG